MTTTWDSTPTAVYLRSLGWQEPTEFRSAQQVSADWQAAYGTSPSEAQVRQSMLADRLGQRVVNVDTRSPFEAAGDQVLAARKTEIRVLDDRQLQAQAAAYNAAIRAGLGTIRPGQSDVPYWSSAKSAGRPWRYVAFGPPGGDAAAAAVLDAWQGEAAALRAAISASLPPGSPR